MHKKVYTFKICILTISKIYFDLVVIFTLYQFILPVLTNDEKIRIYNLKKGGMSYRDIGLLMNMKRSAVQQVIDRYGKPLKKRGRKFKISKRDKRRMISIIDDRNDEGKKTTCNLIKNELGLNVHRSTILRELKSLKCHYSNLPSKFKLNYKVKRKRVEKCKEYIINNVNWCDTIFSDEKKFSLYGCDSYYSWFHGNKTPKHIRRVLRAPSVMVWGMITPNGLLSIRFLDGRQNSKKYISLLKDVLIPIGKLNVGDKFIYQQDNCPIHASKETGQFMKTANLNVLKWPAYSPDINIIENVWSILSNLVYQDGYPKNVSLLKSKILESVKIINETKRSSILNLYGSVRKRLCEVIWKKGERLSC